MIKLKRIYEYPKGEGFGVLVDGIWPRGIKKESIDLWMKDLAPSTELRKWYSHDPAKCSEFKVRYRKELNGKEEGVKKILDLSSQREIILLYATSSKCNNGEVLLEYLNSYKR